MINLPEYETRNLYEAAYYMAMGAEFKRADKVGTKAFNILLDCVSDKWVWAWSTGEPMINAKTFRKKRERLKQLIAESRRLNNTIEFSKS